MKKKIILASASPRRQELLTQIGLDFEVHPSDWEEKTEKELPGEVVQELSFHKAMEVYHRLQVGAGESLAEESLVVIGADTIVACQGQILGKPGDKERAAGMLRLLQGDVHQVYTGVSLVWQEQGKTESFSFYECTDVRVFPMKEEEIAGYVETREPMDKAGAYGIQGRFAAFIRGIDGDYNNVVGPSGGKALSGNEKKRTNLGERHWDDEKSCNF